MIKRRLRFATPFVLVVACKAPAPTHPEEQTEEVVPVVVNLGPPIDAAVAAVPEEPAKPDASVLGEGEPPTPTIRALLVEAVPDGYSGSVMIFDAGSKRGVTEQRASARLLERDSDRPLRGGQIKITDCTMYWCRGMVTLLPVEVERNPHVEIRPKDLDAERRFVETRRQDMCCANPPRPKPPTVNPPPPRRVRVLKTEVESDKTLVWIPVGTDDGVTYKNSSACVLDRGDRCRPDGVLVLIRCDKRVCIGRSELSNDEVRASPAIEVRFK